MHIICLGDSICYGDGVNQNKAWVSLTEDNLKKNYPNLSVLNAGLNGDTAAGGLLRLPPLLKSVPDILYVQFGLNDAWQNLNPDTYIAAMREIVHKALEKGTRHIILATNHPVCPLAEQKLYGGKEFSVRARYFNEILREAFCLPPQRLLLADLETVFQSFGEPKKQAELLLYDGVHLSEAGNKFYAKNLEPFFLECMNKI